MPAFTFEKISPPVRSTTPPVAIDANPASPNPISPANRKTSRLFVRMLDRFALARMRRDEAADASPHT